MLDGLGAPAAWAVMKRTGDALQTRFTETKTNTADAERLRERATKITTVEDLLKDRRSLSVVLEAFQLEGEIDKKAILRKLMTEPLDDEKSFANRMADPRYTQLAAAFAGRSDAPLGSTALVDSILQKAMVNRFEKASGDANPGMRAALYFKRTIGAVTSIPQILSDKALTEVVRGGLGLPEQFGLLDYDKQKAILTRRLDPATFSDPKAMDRLTVRYLNQVDSAAPTNPILGLLSGGTGSMPGLLGQRVSFSV
ncbi:DUF1217 domain-containing protein [Humitalea sp. 24SJ18S-53]|uniref:DUF1217 domain-containing protein n=1 Tax=Humitalea sp. 24SJ18S-53 TaxID=3422307 RepID=UPI003D6792E4